MGKRLIITEEERNEILNLHKSHIFEAPGDTVLGNQDTPVVGATPSGPTIADTMNKPSVPTQQSTQKPLNQPTPGKNTKVETLQNTLNEKFKSGLGADGKWGIKTATAVLNSLKSLPSNQPIEKLPTLPGTPIARTNTTTQLAPGQPTPPQQQEPDKMKDVEGAVTPIQGLRRRLQRR
jgi:hypothetical protein